MRGKYLFLSSWVVCFLLISIHAINSEPAQKKKGQENIQHEITVTLKLVQVYVTDKKGNPLLDLKKEDFELSDNGKAQIITDFERHVLSLPSLKTVEVQQPRKEVARVERTGRKFFLFFDFAFNSLGGIDMAKKAASHFIDSQIEPTDEVGVLSYSTEKGLFLHEYLTTDHAKIREVVDNIGSGEGLGRAGRLMKELESEIVSGIAGGFDRLKMLKAAREDFIRTAGKVEWGREARAFSKAVKDLAKALRYIPGYKHIVLFSYGIPSFLAYPSALSIKPQLDKTNLAASDSLGLRNRYEEMAKELRASNSPVYAVNVEGIYSDFMDREAVTPHAHQITRRYEPDPGIDVRDLRGETSLINLAKKTDGRYFGNVNDYKKIVEEIQSITSSYYVLGYYIDEKWDGKYHKIKVKVKRKGCKVYGQRGYFNPKPFNKYTELEKKLHLVDLALNEKPHFEEPVHFPLNTLPYSVEKKSNVLMMTKLIPDKMQEVTAEKAEIIFLIFDEKKNIAGYQRMEADDLRFSQDDIFCYAIASLFPGHYDCRTVIRNLESGKGAIASSSLIIPKIPDSGLSLYPPLLLIPKKNVFYINATAKGKKEGEDEYSALENIYPFDTTQYAPLVGELKKETSRLLVLIRCSIFDIPQSEIKMYAQLVYQPTNQTVPLNFETDIKYQDNNLIFSLELQPNELEPGRYYLYFFAEEMNTQEKAHVNTTFIID